MAPQYSSASYGGMPTAPYGQQVTRCCASPLCCVSAAASHEQMMIDCREGSCTAVLMCQRHSSTVLSRSLAALKGFTAIGIRVSRRPQLNPGLVTVQAYPGSFTGQPQYSAASYPGAMPPLYGYGAQPGMVAPGAGYGGGLRPGQISQDDNCSIQ
jgi:hypothetical protein